MCYTYIYLFFCDGVARYVLAVIPITSRHCSRPAISVWDLRHNQSQEGGGVVRQPRRRSGTLPTPVMHRAPENGTAGYLTARIEARAW